MSEFYNIKIDREDLITILTVLSLERKQTHSEMIKFQIEKAYKNVYDQKGCVIRK